MKKILVALLVVIMIIAIGGYFFPKAPKTVQEPYGSVTGPNLVRSDQTINGVTRWYTGVSLIKASSTLCAIKSPNATSTLVSAAINFSKSTSSAYMVELAKSSTAYATTTLIGTKFDVAASNLATIVASSTNASAGSNVFGPNQYFVVKWAVANAGYGAGTVPTGRCQAVFESY